MKKNTVKFALIAALLGVGLTIKATPAMADWKSCARDCFWANHDLGDQMVCTASCDGWFY